MIQPGQSAATNPKEALISTCLRWILTVSKPAEYFVFDLNCGCGDNRNNGANVEGTGILARRSLTALGVRGWMFLCDIRKENAVQAETRFRRQVQAEFGFRNGVSAFFEVADNRDFVRRVPEMVQKMGASNYEARGMIIADDDGLKAPLDGIAAALNVCPNIDVIIHLCGAKQVWSYWARHPDCTKFRPSETSGSVKSIDEIIRKIPKRHWLISVPFRAKVGRDHTVLCGSNIYLKQIKNMPGRPDMYRLDSSEGMQLLYNYRPKGAA